MIYTDFYDKYDTMRKANAMAYKHIQFLTTHMCNVTVPDTLCIHVEYGVVIVHTVSKYSINCGTLQANAMWKMNTLINNGSILMTHN